MIDCFQQLIEPFAVQTIIRLTDAINFYFVGRKKKMITQTKQKTKNHNIFLIKNIMGTIYHI